MQAALKESMSLYNDRISEVARRYALECSCAGNVVPCSDCWKIAEVSVIRYAKALPRYSVACSCAGSSPCSKCWEAAEADVDGYYRAIEDEEARIERLYRGYSETGKKLES
jgi:hypothetical protein